MRQAMEKGKGPSREEKEASRKGKQEENIQPLWMGRTHTA